MTDAELRADAMHRLSYDPETGAFVWVKSECARMNGKLAGTWNGGYLRIRLGGRRLYANQLAFLIVRGFLPPEVDHRDGDSRNNRWVNLRKATHSQNMKNQRHLRRNNKTGARGVHRDGARFRASIRVDYRLIDLGRFDTLPVASAARRAAEHEHFGEFAPCPGC